MSQFDNRPIPLTKKVSIPPDYCFNHVDCFICGRKNDYLFTIAAAHIQYVLVNCKTEYFKLAFLPTVQDCRFAIWNKADQNNLLTAYCINKFERPTYNSAVSWRLYWYNIYREVERIMQLIKEFDYEAILADISKFDPRLELEHPFFDVMTCIEGYRAKFD